MSEKEKDNRDHFNPANCTCCPRECRADRTGAKLGYCQSGEGLAISSICAHRGEEPVLSGKHGICNIFFARCNMQCIYCQNYQISRNEGPSDAVEMSLPTVIGKVVEILEAGSTLVGFVSPSHYVRQVLSIVEGLHAVGRQPKFVYNSNAYDRLFTIKALERTIDVWLPDLKYMDEQLGREYSDTKNYPEIATIAIKEMFHQMGANIRLDDNGNIERGLIIRHLILPGHVENSIAVLRWIAEELSPSVHISLMSQYHPTPHVANHPNLGRTLRAGEYREVLDEFDRLGFYRGWVQELESPFEYRPDFNRPHPFES